MEEIIRSGLAKLGLLDRVPVEAPEQLAEYGRLMLEKNQVMNLTAIKEPEGVARLHMLDSAALLLYADFQGKTFIDVGTGAGLPGLPIKILVPSLQVTLLDSLGKRVSWLNETCTRLGLDGIHAVHARAEEQALIKGWRDSFDFAAARAVATLSVLCELCIPYVKPGGTFLAMKSTSADQELEEAAHAIKLLGSCAEPSVDYTIPETQITHRIIPIRKLAPTLKGYPRRWAAIQKRSL